MAAVLLRLAVILGRPADLSSDADGYIAHAKVLMEGRGFSGPYTGRPTAYRPPGYPLLIAALTGSRTPESTVAMLHMAVGVVTVLLTKYLAEMAGLSQRWSIFAAALTAADPMLIRYTALPMTEVLSALLLTASLCAFYKYRAALAFSSSSQGLQRSGGRLTFWMTGIITGILPGLGTLVRPVCLVVALLLTVLLLVEVATGRRSVKPELRSSFRQYFSGICAALLPLLFLALVMLPWIWRNYNQFQRFIPATTHGGYTLLLGNNEEYYRDVVNGDWSKPWDGNALNAWQQRTLKECEQAGVLPSDEPGNDAWMYKKAFDTIARQPVTFLKACLLRLSRFCSVRMAADSTMPWPVTIAVAIWYLTLWIGIAVAGIRFVIRSDRYSEGPMWLAIAAFVMIHTFYWTDGRMRAPLVPILSVLGCIGGKSMVLWFQRKLATGKQQ